MYPLHMLMFLLSASLLQPQKPLTDAERLVALQLSVACREAGDKFWQQGGYAKQAGFMSDYQTHYNRQDSKCYIRIVKMTDEPTNKTFFILVHDAVDNDIIGGRFSKYDGEKYVVTSIYRNGISLDTPTVDDRAWFDNLMIR